MLIVEHDLPGFRRDHFIKGIRRQGYRPGPDGVAENRPVRKVLRSGETAFEYERVGPAAGRSWDDWQQISTCFWRRAPRPLVSI